MHHLELSEQEIIRRQSLNELRNLGIEPYPAALYEVNAYSTDIKEEFNDEEKRPVSIERLEAAIAHIKHKLRATGEREIKSLVLGELVMGELQKLDEVAYIRFASVYKSFEDVAAFRELIERLQQDARGA